MKKFLYKESITAIAFLIIIFAVGGASVFLNFGKYAYHFIKGDTSRELSLVLSELKTVADDTFGDKIAFQPQFIKVYSAAQKLMNTSVYDDALYGYIVKDSDGKLHFPMYAEPTDAQAQNTVDFYNYLKAKNIPMLYILAPCKYIEGVTKLPYGIEFYPDRNTDEFLSYLSAEGVDFLDLRQSLKVSGLDLSDCYFDTDHHWRHSTAFFAYSTAIEHIRLSYNMDLDPEGFYTDLANYKTLDFENAFLGSQGRRVGASASGKDDISIILPNFDTNYTVYNGKDNSLLWQGAFEDTILRKRLLTLSDENANMYAAYFEYDYEHLIIENNNIENGKHIIILKDSYGLPFSAFLSTATEKLEMIDLRSFDKNRLCEYIETASPDMVIVMYNNGSFSETMYDFGVPKA